jgi:hypothetical protein
MMVAELVGEGSYLTLARQAAASIDARNAEAMRLQQASIADRLPLQRRMSIMEKRVVALCTILAQLPNGVWRQVTSAMVNLALPSELRLKNNLEANKIINLADAQGLLTQVMVNRGAGRDEISLTPAGFKLAAQAADTP